MKCCEFDPVLQGSKPKKKDSQLLHTSLLSPHVIYEENEVF